MKDKYSSKAQAENGIDNTTIMTPLRVKQSILVNSPAAPQATQSDWNEADPTAPAYIKNKPVIPNKTSQLTNDSNFISDASYVHTDNNYTTTEKTKLSNIEDGAEVNVQSDWAQTNQASDDYIKNKPTIPTVNNGTLTIQKNGTTVQTFSANQSGDATANITVPTKVSDLTNDSGFLTTETDPVYSSSAAATITNQDITNWNAAEANVIEEVQVDGVPLTVTNKSVNITGKQDTLVSGTNIKTINNQSLLGSGDIQVGGGGSSTDVQINGTSITSGGVANIITKSAYDQYSNNIVTEDDVKFYSFTEASLLNMNSTSSSTYQELAEAVAKRSRIFIYKSNMLSSYFKYSAVIRLLTDSLSPSGFEHTVMYYFDADNNYAEMDITVSGTTVTVTKRIINDSGRGCTVGQGGDGTSNPYYKFADISIPSSTNWYDDTITFKVTRGFADGTTATGILSAHIRTQGSGYWESGELMWEYANKGINYDRFFICHNTGAAPAIAELYVYCPDAYVCWHFDVLQECNRVERNIVKWNLYDNITTNGGSASLPSSLTNDTSYYSELRNDWKVAWLPAGGEGLEPLPIPFPDYNNQETVLGWLPDYKLDYKDGTTSSTGHCKIVLGNDKGAGTDYNSQGGLDIYCSGTGRNSVLGGTHNNNYINTLPDKGGTFAMTSDIPTVNNGTLTIQKNGSTVATFTANQSGNATANITGIPEFSEGTGIISRSSGATLNSSAYYKYGKVVQLRVVITSSGTTNAGSDCFIGTLNNSSLYPTQNISGIGYNGSCGVIMNVQSNGSINCRVIGANLGSGKNIGISATYITV